LRNCFVIVFILLLAFGCNKNDSSAIRFEKRFGIQNNRQGITQFELNMMSAGMVDVQKMSPDILVELKYSTVDNVWKSDLYGNLTKAYLHVTAAERLLKAQQILNDEKPNYRLLIYDAARPASVQKIMWETLNVAPGIKHWYIANPVRGSLHNYGMAVDITIVGADGTPLDMGTNFDFFGHPAYSGMEKYYLQTGQLNQEQYENRIYLSNLMRRAGFTPSSTEWWHYNACSISYARQYCKIVP